MNEKNNFYTSKFFSFLFLVLLVSSCVTEEEIVDDSGQNEFQTFGIRHDRQLSEYETIATNVAPYNTSDYPDFSSVVFFSYSFNGSSNHEFIASGVLVAPNWILTAGHNFFVSDDNSQPALPSGIQVFVGNNPNNPTRTINVTQLVFHPTWLDDNDIYGKANDFCLVKLANPITNITPAKLATTTSEPIGNTVWYCGYGDYSQRPGQDPNAYSKKHAMENILDRKSDGIVSKTKSGEEYKGGLVAFDFDSPSGDINSLGDSFISEDEPLLGTGTSEANARTFEGGTVEGDSGGPLFVKMNGQWTVIGILSGGATEPVRGHKDGDYGDISIFTRVSTFADWINTVIK